MPHLRSNIYLGYRTWLGGMPVDSLDNNSFWESFLHINSCLFWGLFCSLSNLNQFLFIPSFWAVWILRGVVFLNSIAELTIRSQLRLYLNFYELWVMDSRYGWQIQAHTHWSCWPWFPASKSACFSPGYSLREMLTVINYFRIHRAENRENQNINVHYWKY